jgi:hypothetical protein
MNYRSDELAEGSAMEPVMELNIPAGPPVPEVKS